jgi:uncharacterized protein
VKKAIAAAQQAYDDGQAALKKQDWTAYGKAQQALRDALQRAVDADAKAKPAPKGS